MPTKYINLIDAHFQNSSLFRHLPIFDVIHYHGHPDGKVQLYKAVREEQECHLLALTVIRKEEDFLWDSAEDLLERSMYEAAARVHGIYTFDLLTFDIHNEVKTFNYAELVTMVAGNSRKIPPGEQRLVKYSSAYGILQKMVAEEWGKIVFKTSVDIYKDKPVFLDLLIKKLFQLSGPYAHKPLIILLNDLSSEPIFNPGDKDQQKRLAAVVNEQSQSTIDFLPEVYIQDKNGARELLSGTEVR
ncbi:MAG: hypothetical protein Q8Q08_06970 [Candidatus Omnitrophota bacterium]|nr:hypothetical protein [Candidatus Omnitrophota bacterium]MDZ4241571.1 hypothetical protein [Candidatus Omnitrophota bacterium]